MYCYPSLENGVTVQVDSVYEDSFRVQLLAVALNSGLHLIAFICIVCILLNLHSNSVSFWHFTKQCSGLLLAKSTLACSLAFLDF